MLESLWSDSGKGRDRELLLGGSVPGEILPSEVAGETGAGMVDEDREEASEAGVKEGRPPSEAVTGALK